MEIVQKIPSEMSPEDLKTIHELIVKGDEVQANSLTHRLKQAALVSYVLVDHRICAVAVMKQPNLEYKNRTFRKAKSNEDPSTYGLELGYVFTDDDYRGQGLASELCCRLCRVFISKDIFATVRIDNKAMRGILNKIGFVQTGNCFPGRTKSIQLLLYFKPRVVGPLP